jgi:DNA polymerase-3 subunit epsilon
MLHKSSDTIATAENYLGKAPFCIVDLETSGLSPASCEITEIGVILVDENFVIVKEISHLTKIRYRLDARITQITGITNRMLETQGIALGDAHSQFREFIGDHPTFAHNAKFDNGFLTAADARFCSDEPTALHCSIPVFKHKKPGLPKYSLSFLSEHFGVSYSGSHRALRDCHITLACLRKMLGK